MPTLPLMRSMYRRGDDVPTVNSDVDDGDVVPTATPPDANVDVALVDVATYAGA